MEIDRQSPRQLADPKTEGGLVPRRIQSDIGYASHLDAWMEILVHPGVRPREGPLIAEIRHGQERFEAPEAP
jgi:hypothetical protein